MLPAYLSAFLQNRWRIVAMTFIYGTGVATVVLPLALGAAALRQFILGQHAVAFGIGGALLVALGIYTLLGGSVSIPMPHLRQTNRRGPLGIYAMGVVAGLASACCAPVLIGVVAISGLAPSFFTSLALGLAYIAGMVGPLFVMALFWTRIEPKLDKVTRPRTVRLHLGILSRELSGTAFTSGMLLLAMGGVTLWMAASGQSMLSAGGWEANFAAALNHFGHIIDDALGGVPGIFVVIALAVIVILLLFKAGAEVGWWGRNALGHQKNEQGQTTALMTPIDEKGQDANVE
jgi:cytochrome c biogenesis protein CcdA